MAFDINEFKEITSLDFQRPTLFDVEFQSDKLTEEERKLLRFLVNKVNILGVVMGDQLYREMTLTIYEKEGNVVEALIPKLDGPLTVTLYKQDGGIASQMSYQFELISYEGTLNWEAYSELMFWTVKGSVEQL